MKLTLFIVSVIPFLAFGGSLSIIGPCSESPLSIHEFELSSESNVGFVTIELLKEAGIPFRGTEMGVSSIYKTPVGFEAIEVISDTEINAYGWCYSLNGEDPGTYPNEVKVETSDRITWWYGFAKYKEGEWITQCSPSYKRRAAQFCE